MNRIGISFLALIIGAISISAMASPPRLMVRLESTNQLVFTVSPVVANNFYEIYARADGAEGHWIRIAQMGGTTNGTATVRYLFASKPTPPQSLATLTPTSLANWKFVAGLAADSDGDGLPDMYEDLVTRTDPISMDTGDVATMDGYRDPDGDDWTNLDELSHGTDPLMADPPPKTQVDIAYYSMSANDTTRDKVVLTMTVAGAVLPDYFLVEKAIRTRQRLSEDSAKGRQLPPRYTNGTPTNGTPAARLSRPMIRQPAIQPATDPFETVARVFTQPGVREYKYVETNVDSFLRPVYQTRAHFTPPMHTFLDPLNATSVRESMRSVKSQKIVGGYSLTATNPIPHARYLLLVRDRSHPFWRAGGYFAASTNRDPIHLQVDAKGMMSVDQRPFAMPVVRFAPVLIDPEFKAGWGEDSDGDGLPDIYEVLVTKTDPINGDTGNTGELDGYKDPDKDGWSNLEEFRRRTNPLEAEKIPASIEFKNPKSIVEIMRAQILQSDLPYETSIQIRMAGSDWYAPLKQPLITLFDTSNPRDDRKPLGDFDLLISRRVPDGPIQRPIEWP